MCTRSGNVAALLARTVMLRLGSTLITKLKVTRSVTYTLALLKVEALSHSLRLVEFSNGLRRSGSEI